jgi:glycosyltransferase involved in cell wall biosynthesis
MKDRRMKMIWNSNGIFVPSGYGVEQRDMLNRFKTDGWNLAQIAFSGVEAAMIKLNDIPIYPKMADPWGSDAMMFHSRHFGADVVFSMQDIWTLQPQYLQQLPRWIPYIPIDQDPVPVGVLANLRYAYKIITFSRWGQQVLQKAGFTSRLIVEGTDTNIFKPMDKNACKKELGIPPGSFVVGMVGANKENPPRKGWQQALEAFKLFHDAHPEAIFFFQTNQNGPGGFPIRYYAEYLKISKYVMNLDEYLGTFHLNSDVMVKVYNAFDLLCHPSLSEGFGLCVVEAQSCGVPVIVNNCCSMPELIVSRARPARSVRRRLSGILTPSATITSPAPSQSTRRWRRSTGQTGGKMARAARGHVLQKYNIDTIVKEQWTPYLEELQLELLGKPVDKKS